MLVLGLKKFNRYYCCISAWCAAHSTVILLILLTLSLGVKSIVWFLDSGISRDAALYLYTAQNWHDTGVLSGDKRIPTMLFCLMRGFMFLGLNAEASGILITLLMGSWITLVGYGIALESTQSKKIALLAAVFFAFHPDITALSHEVQRDVPYLCLAGITAWLAIAGIRRKKWYLWAGSGAMAALAFMTRYETMELFPLVLAALVVCVLTKLMRWKNALLYGLSFGSFFAVTLAVFIWLSGFHHVFSEYSNYYKGKFYKVTNLSEFAPEKGGE